MGTAKRERQRANKLKQQEEIARSESRRRSTKIGVLVVAAIVAVFVIVVIAGQITGDDDASGAPAVAAVDAEAAVAGSSS
ncbi:MAG: hypothetical protein AB8G26_04125 [Ilumatobacter sp.]